MYLSQVLLALLLGGLMGMIGQGIRAVAGLKKMNDDAASSGATSADLFIASRLVVSLLIGFIAGVIAAISVGLDNLINIDPGKVSTLLGIAAAGYAGTDFIEALAPSIIGAAGQTVTPKPVVPTPPVAQGPPNPPAGPAPNAPLMRAVGGVTYGSLVPGGFYSSDPTNLSIPRSIRTNNPGALNYSKWQSTRKGFVGVTQADSAGNVTTIYRTPEHGAAAWYHLLSEIYGFGAAATFTLPSLAQKYAGAPSGAAVNAYVAGWVKWSSGALTSASTFNANDPSQMLVLAKAMFSHEAGQTTPVQDAQIVFAIQNEQMGTLPS
jgi:hypothetical protein